MSSFLLQTIADRRLEILRLLYQADGSSNTGSLETGLRARGYDGRALPFGCVEEDCDVLARHGLVFLERLDGPFGDVVTVKLGKLGVAYLQRRIPAVDDVSYPELGI